MNTTMKKSLFFVFVAGLGLALSSGCRKKENTIAIIHVMNVANQPVSGAQVVLYGKSTINQPANVVLYDTTQTNSDGEGIIKIEEETTSEETVFIQ
jgi:hypothetical protein